MTAFHVTNGTHAGWRRVDEARTEPWTCSCGHENKPNYRNCISCSGGRP